MGFGKDGKGVIIREDFTQALGALATETAIKGTSLAITDDFRMLKAMIAAHLTGLTAGEGQGLLFGLCNDDLTATDIAECLRANGPLNSSDRDLQEFAERYATVISQAGHVTEIASGTQLTFFNEAGGPLIVTKPRWTFNKGVGWNWFVFNNGPNLTTGASVRVIATEYGVWVG